MNQPNITAVLHHHISLTERNKIAHDMIKEDPQTTIKQYVELIDDLNAIHDDLQKQDLPKGI